MTDAGETKGGGLYADTPTSLEPPVGDAVPRGPTAAFLVLLTLVGVVAAILRLAGS